MLRSLAVLVVATTALAANPQPAGAAARLEVEAGYDGNFVPGRLVPIRVRISADRLIEGVLQVQVKVPGEAIPVSIPVEVSGGTDKEYVVALPTSAAMPQTQVIASLGGDLTGEADLTFTGDTELVGLLPGVANRAPAPTPLPADLGTARFSLLDDADLATPGALDPLGTVVTGPDGLEPLTEPARQNLLTWLDQGGRLVLDAAPGAAGDQVEGLPDVWQPGAASRIRAGRGEVRFSSGAAADGRWDEVVEPTPLVLPGELAASGWMWVQESVADAVASDGGLRIPTVGWLAGFLVAYVALAGPVLFLVLRRARRPGWAWLAIPALAGLFALGAFVVGNDLRSGSEASHGSVVHTGPAGARVLSYVGLVSRNGTDGRAEFPPGWTASGLTSALGDTRVVFDDPFGGAGSNVEVNSAHVRLGSDTTVGEIDLDPGGFGIVTGWGALDDTSGLTATATAAADGTVSGTLRNDTDATLGELLVMVGYRSWGSSEELAPGEEIEWSIDGAQRFSLEEGPPEEPWSDDIGWMDGKPLSNSPVNYALWAEMTGRLADPYPTGLVVAAGWTRGWTPPVDVGGSIDAGRTAFVTEAPVAGAAGSVPAAAVARDYLRGPATVAVDETRFGDVRDRLENDFGVVLGGAVVRYTLPDASSPAPALQASLHGSVLAAEAWDGTSWVPLELRNRAGEVVDETTFSERNFDPWTAEENLAAVPAAAVRDGVVYLRLVTMGADGPIAVGMPSLGEAR